MMTTRYLPRPKGLNGRPLTDKRLITLVEQVVKDNPRRKNPIKAGSDPAASQCVYQVGDRRCIIGEVLHRLGADVSEFPQQDPINIVAIPGGEVSVNHWFTREALKMATDIQYEFDRDRSTWSTAWKRVKLP